MKTIKNSKIILLMLLLFITIVSCKDEACGYDEKQFPDTCVLESELNLSTGIDANGVVIPPGSGVIDPFWRLLNNPPLITCSDPLVSTINGNAYVINYNDFAPNNWVNQAGSTTLAPVDLGITNTFACNNANNSDDDKVPYIFERPFCVLKDTQIDFSFTFKADDQIYFELIDNSNNLVLSTSSTYIWTGTGIQTWTTTGVFLSSGSYSIRGYLVNVHNTVLGFSLLGNLRTTNGDESISNNIEGCCENNVINILNILDNDCSETYDSTIDGIGQNWVFNLKDSSNTIIRTATTDVNGNIIFSGLPDGTYTIEIVSQSGWVTQIPALGTITVTLANNEVKIIEFFNCIDI